MGRSPNGWNHTLLEVEARSKNAFARVNFRLLCVAFSTMDSLLSVYESAQRHAASTSHEIGRNQSAKPPMLRNLRRESIRCFSYMATGFLDDRSPLLRYFTLVRDGAQAHPLPADWVAYLDSVEPAK